MQKSKKFCLTSITFLVLFVMWTMLVKFVDVRPIGPYESSAGFANLNSFVHDLTGVNFPLYNITDLLGLVPFFACFLFGLLGLAQLIKRRAIKEVDFDIICLGVYYLIVICFYLFFETVVINYRPVLIKGMLEASYPSSTTLLVLSVMPTAVIQTNRRIKNKIARKILNTIIVLFIIFMICGRILSGVHWITDIIGGLLLGISLISAYLSIISVKN